MRPSPPAPDAASQPEQVRPCLHCGALISYSVGECESCGHPVEAGLTQPDGRVKSCMSCGEVVPYQEIYCRHCQQLSMRVEEPEITPMVDLAQPAPWVDRIPEVVGLAAALSGLAALLFAGFRLFS